MSNVYSWLRMVFGFVFVLASLDKIVHPGAFAEIILNYQILPEVLVWPSALLLPWFEAVCGLALMTGVLARGAAASLVGLLVVFMAALFYNMARGLDISCGCFSTTAHGGEMLQSVIRDSFLLLAGVVVLVKVFRDYRTAHPLPESPEPEPEAGESPEAGDAQAGSDEDLSASEKGFGPDQDSDSDHDPVAAYEARFGRNGDGDGDLDSDKADGEPAGNEVGPATSPDCRTSLK